MAELVEAAEVVEEVADEMVAGLRMISARAAIVAGTLTTLGGAFAGYFVAEKRLRAKYEDLAEQEIDGMREHFRQRLVARDTVKPAIEDLAKMTKSLDYDGAGINTGPPDRGADWPKSDPPIPVPDEDVEEHNVFEDQFVWDAEAEKAKRSEDAPYVIHVDERNEEDYTQTTMTYYEGDDVLTDSSDRVVTEVDNVVGLENMDRFGHGSTDPNVVYIRNEALAVDIEVVKSEGTYEEEVLGLKHSESHDHPRAWDG